MHGSHRGKIGRVFDAWDTPNKNKNLPKILWLVSCFVSTFWGSLNGKLSHFNKFQTIQFSMNIIFCLHTVKCQNSPISNNSV